MRTKLILAVFIWLYTTTNAQVLDSSFVASKVNQELSGADSLHIFLILDSLIQAADFTQTESATQLGIRTGYNSNLTATGRPFAFGNYGTGQSKAVIMFLVVALASIIQVSISKRMEVQR